MCDWISNFGDSVSQNLQSHIRNLKPRMNSLRPVFRYFPQHFFLSSQRLNSTFQRLIYLSTIIIIKIEKKEKIEGKNWYSIYIQLISTFCLLKLNEESWGIENCHHASFYVKREKLSRVETQKNFINPLEKILDVEKKRK